MYNEQLTIFSGVSAESGLLELCRATTENAAKLNEQCTINNVQLAINCNISEHRLHVFN